MKKLISFLLILSVLLFAGCKKSERNENEAPVVPSAYSADLHITLKGKQIEGKYVQKALGNSEITFSSPRALKGISIKYEGTTCTFGYGGLTLSTDLAKLPETNIGKMLIESMQSAAGDSQITKEKVDGNWVYTGENSGHAFTIIQNAQTGFFEHFDMPDYEFEAVLSNFTVE